jgi:hypothetical protein
VTAEQRRRKEADDALHPPVHELLERIEQRLDALERSLS